MFNIRLVEPHIHIPLLIQNNKLCKMNYAVKQRFVANINVYLFRKKYASLI